MVKWTAPHIRVNGDYFQDVAGAASQRLLSYKYDPICLYRLNCDFSHHHNPSL